MAECTDPKSQGISTAFPSSQSSNSGALEVNFNATGAEIFNPNLALSAVQTFNTLNNVANKMFGIEARWFRAVPQERSKDVIFKEYTLSCVEDTPICIKVIATGGNFPDSNYQYDLMGLQYQIPTEVQIDKRYWEEEAGFGTAPQKKDIVYLPLPNKLFQVESAYLKRGFMEQETTWVINLIKYSPEASRREGPELKETIDKYTVSADKLFGEELEDNIQKITNPKQNEPENSTSRDRFRLLDTDLKIIASRIEIGGIIVAESFYNLSTSKKFNAIEYNNSEDNILKNCDRALMSWIRAKRDDAVEHDVIFMEPDDTLTPPANFKIKIKGSRRYQIDDSFHIWRSEKLNLYAKVIDDSYSNNGIYWVIIDKPVIEYLDSIQNNWWTKRNWKLKQKDPINLIDGINTKDSGFRVSLNANQYVKINYGSQEHIAIIDSRLKDEKWYGIVVNIGNTWGQYGVNIWEENPIDTDLKIRSVFRKTLQFTPEDTAVKRYTIDRSNSYMTNIKLFSSTIEEEKQPQELLSYFSQNADRALILDNSDPKLKVPYISQQR